MVSILNNHTSFMYREPHTSISHILNDKASSDGMGASEPTSENINESSISKPVVEEDNGLPSKKRKISVVQDSILLPAKLNSDGINQLLCASNSNLPTYAGHNQGTPLNLPAQPSLTQLPSTIEDRRISFSCDAPSKIPEHRRRPPCPAPPSPPPPAAAPARDFQLSDRAQDAAAAAADGAVAALLGQALAPGPTLVQQILGRHALQQQLLAIQGERQRLELQAKYVQMLELQHLSILAGLSPAQPDPAPCSPPSESPAGPGHHPPAPTTQQLADAFAAGGRHISAPPLPLTAAADGADRVVIPRSLGQRPELGAAEPEGRGPVLPPIKLNDLLTPAAQPAILATAVTTAAAAPAGGAEGVAVGPTQPASASAPVTTATQAQVRRAAPCAGVVTA
jgi:hypothetical protein